MNGEIEHVLNLSGLVSAFRRKPESRETRITLYAWIPAYAGMTMEKHNVRIPAWAGTTISE